MSTSSPSNADLRACLAAVDAAISEHMIRLQKLEDYRQSVLRELGSIVYPVLSLPNEITSEIFLQCLPDIPGPNLNSKTFPRAPLGVCKAWRALALSTPRLWMHLGLDLRSASVRWKWRELIEIWFSRAAPHLSTLSIRAKSWKHGDAGSEMIRPILQRYAPRLRIIQLEVTAQHCATIVDVQSFPVLEQLALTVVEDGRLPGPAQLFRDAPRLTQLRLNVGDWNSPSSFDLPYQQLTKITIGELILEELAVVLENAPLLRELDCTPSHLGVSTYPTHHTLHTLTLRGGTGGVYKFLRFPALQNLTIYRPQYQCIPEEEFHHFRSHFHHSLQRFSYHGFRSPYKCPIDFVWLRWMPNLTEITLTNIDSVERKPTNYSALVFRFIIFLNRGIHTTALPNLQSLDMEDHRFGIRPAALANILSTRSRAERRLAPLRSFRLICAPTRDGFEVLRGLVDQGMQIHVGPDRETNVV
ncbi:hypothetical protein FB45DRAFT_1083159 [Roridomyces roridus]|uniref:F-box domain-containing protein n=1 Tax=Roridomyces roridus TaxID=1738132 RepID=A0AAD7AYB0_9AGAR|nr:hypothetical protein FB45DRAFT_1083159 [Roridomyces roridus]